MQWRRGCGEATHFSDCLVEPFSARELLARIRGILRRTRALQPNFEKQREGGKREHTGGQGEMGADEPEDRHIEEDDEVPVRE